MARSRDRERTSPRPDGVEVAGMGRALRGLLRAPFDEGAAAPRPRAPSLGVPRRQITVDEPQRVMNPGIYGTPEEVADAAIRRLADEDPALYDLFGVKRGDLADMARDYGEGTGSIVPFKRNPRGSPAAQNVTTDRNADRIVRTVEEVRKRSPAFAEGMEGWYVMEPAYRRLVDLVGKEEATRRYEQLNTLMGMASPGSNVMAEINRGTAANYFARKGDWETFRRFGGDPSEMRHPHVRAATPEIDRVGGHPYHNTAQAPAMAKYLREGQMNMGSAKVPAYVQASRPQGQHSWRVPVADAHFVRAVGLADTRGPRVKGDEGASARLPEVQTLAPWWRTKVADRLGLDPVRAQAMTWGVFGPQTGVDSPLGAPKLELMSRRIRDTAQRLGIDPAVLRDRVLLGEDFSAVAPGLMDMLTVEQTV